MLNPKECEKCCKKQVLKVAKILEICPSEVEKQYDEALAKKSFKTAPEYAEFIFECFKKITGVKDPYKEIKRSQNKEALDLLPKVYKLLEGTTDMLQKMLNLAITGNMLDYGVFDDIDVKDYILKIINTEFYKNDIENLRADLEHSKTILYISDNAGEIIFDLEFIKYLEANGKTVYLAVRGGPAINDICIDDIDELPISSKTKIINTACATPGVVLEKTSPEFRNLFYSCDTVISKGQGNFETLHNLELKPKRMYLLFLAKCFVVSNYLNAPENSKFLINCNKIK